MGKETFEVARIASPEDIAESCERSPPASGAAR